MSQALMPWLTMFNATGVGEDMLPKVLSEAKALAMEDLGPL